MTTISRAPNETYYLTFISELKEFLSIPDIQRVVAEDRIDTIYRSIRKQYENNIEFLVPGVLTVAEIETEQGTKHFLIDGQHRFSAYVKLYEECKCDTKVLVNNLKVANDSELRKVFNMINNTVPVTEIPPALDLKTYKTIVQYFTDRYKKCFSNAPSGKCQRPNVHKSAFEHFVQEVLEKYPNNTLNLLIQLNEHLKTLNVMAFKQKRDSLQKIDEFRTKAMTSGGLLFGLYPDLNELFPVLEKVHLESVAEAKQAEVESKNSENVLLIPFFHE